MAVLASDIFQRAGRVLQDAAFVRWTLPELLDWLNDGQREVVLNRPEANSQNIVMAMAAGTQQMLPSQYLALVRAVRNLKSGVESPRAGGRIIKSVQREIMDAANPSWHDTDETLATKEVRHVIFSQDDPLTFYVYPPNDGTGFIEAVVSEEPDTIPLPGSPNVIGSYTVAISIQPIYANALLDYILFRAYSKDAQYAPGIARAQAHYQLFANSLGIKMANSMRLNPNTSAVKPSENAA